MKKAERRLSEFNFEHEGSHVALVGKFQGGPANGRTTLLTKATEDITQEQVEESLSSLDKSLSSQEGVTNQTEGYTLSDNDKKQEDSMSEEMVAKSVMEAEVTKAVEAAVAKALEEKDLELVAKSAELGAAQELIKAFEQKEKESVAKARKDALKQAGVAEDQVEDLYKSTEALTTEHFDAVVKAMGLKEKALVESDMFKEQGVSGEGDVVEEDGVSALTKSYKEKFSKKEAK